MPRTRRRLTAYRSNRRSSMRKRFSSRASAARRIQYAFRRRRYGRRTRGTGRAGRAGLILSGFPSKQLAKLRYTTHIELGNTTQVATHGFRLNSAYNVDIPQVGHQPRFYDQWTALYNRYTVIGSKITMSWQPKTSAETDQNPVRFGIYIPKDANDTSLPAFDSTNTATFFENKRVGPWRNAGIQAIKMAGRPNISVTKKFSAKKYFGVSDLIKNAGYPDEDQGVGNPPGPPANYNATPFSAAREASPRIIAAAMPYVAGIDGTTVTGTYTFLITIDYIVLFDDLIEPGVSVQ